MPFIHFDQEQESTGDDASPAHIALSWPTFSSNYVVIFNNHYKGVAVMSD